MNFISIIIVSYNSAEVIGDCLKSIPMNDRLEVIVIDNASVDNTVDLIRKKFPKVTLTQNSQNIGFASAANQGFQYSSGEYVLFLNPDTILSETFFDQLKIILQSEQRPSIFGCRLTDNKGRRHLSCWKEPSLMTILFESFLPYEFSLRLVTESSDITREVDMVSGACMIIDRNIFEKIGKFDTQFFIYYEDADFCLRARRMGYKIFYIPEIKIVHHIGKSIGLDFNTFFRRMYSSKILFIRKHFNKVKYYIARIIIYIGIIIRIPVYGFLGLIDSKFRDLAIAHLKLL